VTETFTIEVLREAPGMYRARFGLHFSSVHKDARAAIAEILAYMERQGYRLGGL
jgi:inosine/xanthosine triphosphate pyrophosphatase family protein